MEACFVQSMAHVLVWPVCKAEMEQGEVERSDGLLAGLLVDLESCGVQLSSAVVVETLLLLAHCAKLELRSEQACIPLITFPGKYYQAHLFIGITGVFKSGLKLIGNKIYPMTVWLPYMF